MRGVILESLFQRMENDETLFFITADMGINLVERIEERYPERFLNVGIAEQNAIGVAAGLANAGFRPWVYSISHFLVHRCFEQVRNDAGLHQYPITILGTSTGYDNAPLGPTHHIIDDWGLVAGIPGSTIYAPSSVEFASTLVDRTYVDAPGLTYIRVAKGSPSIPGSDQDDVFFCGNADPISPLVISYGGVGARLVEERSLLEECNIALVQRLSPLPEPLKEVLLTQPPLVVVVEDQIARNGLSGEIALFIAQNALGTQLVAQSPGGFDFTVGSTAQDYERSWGLDPLSVTNVVRKHRQA